MTARRGPLLAAILAAAAEEEGGTTALAREAGVSRQALSDLLRGRRCGMTLATFRAIVAYLGVPAEDVLRWLDEEADLPAPRPPNRAAGGRARAAQMRAARDAARRAS